MFTLQKIINNVCFPYKRVDLSKQPLILQKHSNKMFSSGFVTNEMYLIAGKRYLNLTIGKVLNPRLPPITLKEGNCYKYFSV